MLVVQSVIEASVSELPESFHRCKRWKSEDIFLQFQAVAIFAPPGPSIWLSSSTFCVLLSVTFMLCYSRYCTIVSVQFFSFCTYITKFPRWKCRHPLWQLIRPITNYQVFFRAATLCHRKADGTCTLGFCTVSFKQASKIRNVVVVLV